MVHLMSSCTVQMLKNPILGGQHVRDPFLGDLMING